MQATRIQTSTTYKVFSKIKCLKSTESWISIVFFFEYFCIYCHSLFSTPCFALRWYLLFRYVCSSYFPAQSEKTAPEIEDGTMASLIQPVAELLNEHYAAVGILEDWDSTLMLFNVTLELPNYNWQEVSASSCVHWVKCLLFHTQYKIAVLLSSHQKKRSVRFVHALNVAAFNI